MRAFIAVLLVTVFSATAANAIPDFAPTASSGWFAYSRDFMRPPGRSGSRDAGPKYPRVTNDDFRATGKQPTYRDWRY